MRTTGAANGRLPAVALFAATAVLLGLTAGFGLGVWLLLARTEGVGILGASWLALAQVHGRIQLFGFAGLFVMGVGLHVLPRFRAAAAPARGLVAACYGLTLAGLAGRAIAQPSPDLPLRGAVLTLAGVLLVAGTAVFAAAALDRLRSGSNPHRTDEIVIALGVAAMPLAALLAASETIGQAPLVVGAAADDRVVWTMLLGCLATTIFGVWARLAPGFVATPPARSAPLLAGVALWEAGVLALVAGAPLGAALLLAGVLVTTTALGVYGTTIARQPLAGHARLTRLAVRSAFAWAAAGSALLALDAAGVGPASSFLAVSAARHALGLGFVTLMLYGVAARALPSFVGRRLWSLRLQGACLLLANAGVALRVIPQALGLAGAAADGLVAASGLIAYAALVAFALNVVRTLRSSPIPEGVVVRGAVPIAMADERRPR